MDAARRLNGVLRLGECAERAPRGAFELDCRRVPFLFAEQGNGCAHQVKTIGRSVAWLEYGQQGLRCAVQQGFLFAFVRVRTLCIA
jgi:hypothetical protein